MTQIDFAQRLNLIRGEKTQKEFAKLIGVPLTSYTNWLLGISLPKLEHLKRICKITGTSADWLLGLSDVQSTQEIDKIKATNQVAAAESTDVPYLGNHAEKSYCPHCAVKQAQIDKLVDTLHNLSLGRSPNHQRSAFTREKF